MYIWAFMICRRTRIFVRTGPSPESATSYSHSHNFEQQLGSYGPVRKFCIAEPVPGGI